MYAYLKIKEHTKKFIFLFLNNLNVKRKIRVGENIENLTG